jgi:hypothetical protein
MLHYIMFSNTTCYLHWIYSGYFYIDSLQWLFFLYGLLLLSTILIVVYVCWYFSLSVLSLQRVKFFYFVHRFREFRECFVVFFDKHIFFMCQLSVFVTAAIRRSVSSRSIPHLGMSANDCSTMIFVYPVLRTKFGEWPPNITTRPTTTPTT